MTHPMDLRELLEAREGRPTEDRAARKIATFAVIPAAMIGLLAGTQLVGIAEPIGRLLWVCAATAAASGFCVAFVVLGIYSLFGFRPLAVLADALVGALYGLLCGGALAMSLMAFKVIPHVYSLYPLFLIPLGAIAVPLIRAWKDAKRAGESESVNGLADSQT